MISGAKKKEKRKGASNTGIDDPSVHKAELEQIKKKALGCKLETTNSARPISKEKNTEVREKKKHKRVESDVDVKAFRDVW